MSGGHNVSSVAERHGGGGGARAIIVAPSKPLLYPGLIWCSLQSLSYGQRAARPVAPGERLKSARGSILRPGVGRGSRNAVGFPGAAQRTPRTAEAISRIREGNSTY